MYRPSAFALAVVLLATVSPVLPGHCCWAGTAVLCISLGMSAAYNRSKHDLSNSCDRSRYMHGR
jgi:hypothetical protein